MKRPSKTLAVLILSGFLLSGCTSINKHVGGELEFESVGFANGETHYHEVLDQLGPPVLMTALPRGFAFLYESLYVRELQLGIAGSDGFLRLFKLSLANTDLHRKSLLLHFGADGVLIAHGKLMTEEDLGSGGSIQPVLSLQQIVDTSDYEDDYIHTADWGASMLRTLPQTLNTKQSLDSGFAGIEQGGTTTKVGQHTLEMR